jgi:hypothetical protein
MVIMPALKMSKNERPGSNARQTAYRRRRKVRTPIRMLISAMGQKRMLNRPQLRIVAYIAIIPKLGGVWSIGHFALKNDGGRKPVRR